MKKALIIGATGQDGAYLSQLLLKKQYQVHGTSRDAEASSYKSFQHLNVPFTFAQLLGGEQPNDAVHMHSMSTGDFRSVLAVIDSIKPDEIYNLSGQSSVGLSFNQPVATFESFAQANLQILEVIRYLDTSIRYYFAASSEMFGQVEPGQACDENTPFRPRSPYATAKTAGFNTTVNYREAYGLFACSGILFNHESPLRSARYVTGKIVDAAKRIKAGQSQSLELGNIDIHRDWGFAGEYADAMWRMLQLDQPEDFVIATGETHSLLTFIDNIFAAVDLDYREYLVTNNTLHRPLDIQYSAGNPNKAQELLSWQAEVKLPQLAELLLGIEK